MPSTWRPAGERELRVGLAGLGSMGRNHLRLLSARPDARLTAVADPVPAALAAATESSGAQGFAEPLAMIAEAELDALVIAAVGAAVEKHVGPDGAARAVGATTAGSAA
jgi:myo-inositol 2-dehydrogenase/D-chiro-inositol 1-dehydrogenase